MRRIILTLVLSQFLITGMFGQAWLEFLPKKTKSEELLKANTESKSELTLKDYQEAFYTYWKPYNVDSKGYYYEDGVKKKAYGWKQFKRWEWNMKGQVDPKTGKFPEKSAQEIFNEYFKNTQRLKSTTANWSVMGPAKAHSNIIDNYCNLGRINCIAFHPTDNNIYWIGAPSGGLWVTHDNGNTWQCLTDNNNVMGVSDIVIPTDYETSHTIYIATGDKNSWDNSSVGVLKSIDNGKTWDKTGLTANISDWMMATRLLLDPNDNNTIIAATTNGVFKTTDGGTTWDNKLTSLSFNDMEFKPGDFSTLYGATKDGQIYMSNDSGESWKNSHEKSNTRRVALAVTQANPSIVYAVVVNSQSGLEGIYKSTDSGDSFTQTLNGYSLNILGYSTSDPYGQANYDLAITASPSNENTLLVGGIMTWRSDDGGVNWTKVNKSFDGRMDGIATVHVDKHMLKYRSNGDLFECNDGGLALSLNNGNTWTNKTDGMVISQMYKLGVSQTMAGQVITGLQDNGTLLVSNESWTEVGGGDGMECIIDYTDSNIQYKVTQNGGSISRTIDAWGISTDITPYEAGPGAWVTPYIMDPNNPKTLYAGYKEVWKTSDQGDNWEPISNINFPGKIELLAIAPSNSSVLITGEANTIWKTDNGGKSWKEITNNLPLEQSLIQSVIINHFDDKVIWVSLHGYNSDRVYESKDGGETWTNISNGLPQIPSYSLVQNIQSTDENHLYLGTELGVYFKKGDNDWVLYNGGLPNVKIGELEIYYDNNNVDNSRLHAATYGRGLWQTPLAAPVANSPVVKTVEVSLLSYTSAQVSGEVVNEGSSSVTERGFVWSTQSNPTIDDNKISLGAGIGAFNTDIDNLSPATTYFVRAYATNSTGTVYGTNIMRKTGCNPPTTQASNLIVDQINDNSITLSWINNGDPVLVLAKKNTAVDWLPENGVTYATNSNIKEGEDIGGSNIAIYSGTESTCTVSNLDDSFTYHFAVFKYNLSDMCYNIVDPVINNATTTGYCAASGGGNLFFNMVKLADIENKDTGYGGYQNFTDISTNLSVGKTYTLTIDEHLAQFGGFDVGVWIDFNNNKSFEDEGENVVCEEDCLSKTNYDIIIPSDANLGEHRMRIRTKAEKEGCGSSCGETLLGEVEDYTVNIVEDLSTSISEFEDNLFKVYPNPTNGLIKLEGKLLTKARITLMDINGKVCMVKFSENSSYEIDLSSHPSGIYIISIEKDGKGYKKQIVKQ